MSSNFYFERWLQTLARLKQCVNYDSELQSSKHNDKTRCSAAQTLAGVMGEYCSIYNAAIECLRQNMQLQKTAYIAAIINAIVARIIEIKHQQNKLQSINYQFLGQGLIDHKITVFDVEMKDVPIKMEKTENVKSIIAKAFEGAQRRKIEMEIFEKEKEIIEEEECEEIVEWWIEDSNGKAKENKMDMTGLYKVETVISEETLERGKLVTIIQAHERCRKVIQQKRLNEIKRDKWAKHLAGTSKPDPSLEVKARGAMLIQRFFRAYFQLKRQKKIDCRRDKLLGLKTCEKPVNEAQAKVVKVLQQRLDRRKKYESDWEKLLDDLKRKYAEKSDEIAEDFRNQIRDWFLKWFNEIQFIHDIPPENKGGSALIVKDEMPAPTDWLEEYNEFLRMKAANKGKSTLQLQYEKQNEKKSNTDDRRLELRRKKKEAELLRKIMKNPTLHPGFTYPKSKHTENILTVIKEYRRQWSQLDLADETDAKKGTIRAIDVDKVCMEVKMDVRKIVDQDMREEYKRLKDALKKDYDRNGEKMPEGMSVPRKRKSQKKKKNVQVNDKLLSQMEDLVLNGILKEYPRTKFEDFVGEYNFAGAEYRCLYIQGQPFGGETRGIWWERARETMLGLQRILLVGPKGSGKTTLVHALASANDAVLLELNPVSLAEQELSPESLTELVDSIVACAKAVQPCACVIYVRDVHHLYLRKKLAKRESNPNKSLLRKYLIGKMCKKLGKGDHITIIATCREPWLTKSAQLLKKFPSVVLIPNTNYTTVVKILSDWVLSNPNIPADLNVHCLAYYLEGYSFDFLKTALKNFLTADQIVKIAAYGLKPKEVYEYIAEFLEGTPIDYGQYIKWYSEKTDWGKKETKSLQAQLEFRALKEQYEEKMAKKKLRARGKKLVDTNSASDAVADSARAPSATVSEIGNQDAYN